jgi:hypothetical protein
LKYSTLNILSGMLIVSCAVKPQPVPQAAVRAESAKPLAWRTRPAAATQDERMAAADAAAEAQRRLLAAAEANAASELEEQAAGANNPIPAVRASAARRMFWHADAHHPSLSTCTQATSTYGWSPGAPRRAAQAASMSKQTLAFGGKLLVQAGPKRLDLPD